MNGPASPAAAFHHANALTYASLLAGVGTIACAAAGQVAPTGALLALAVIADTFDGAFAGHFVRTAEERAFGAQLDSLSDAIAFGAAPAISMAILAPRGGSPIVDALWWLAVFAYAACAITRLAFFNVTRETRTGFVGLPAPVAALIWASVLLFDPSAVLSALVLLAGASGMVAPLAVPRPTGLALAAFVVWPVIVIAAHVA